MRRASALPAVLLLAAFLTACGDESTTDGSERKPDASSADAPQLNPRTASFAVLDDSRAELALLSQGNLGAAFQADPSSGDDQDVDPAAETPTGCDADVSFEDRLDPDGLAIGDADIDYWLVDDARLMAVTSKVSSFGDEATAAAAFEALHEDLGECTHFEETAEDGSESMVIDVTVDTEPATDDVDDQFAMVGGGSWMFEGQDVPVGVGFSIARIDGNVTMVMLLSIGVTEDNELLAPYTEIAADRLVVVAADGTPEDVPAPLPTSTPPVRVPIERAPATLEEFLASAPGILGD